MNLPFVLEVEVIERISDKQSKPNSWYITTRVLPMLCKGVSNHSIDNQKRKQEWKIPVVTGIPYGVYRASNSWCILDNLLENLF